MTIDRQRIAAVTVLTELGWQWKDGKWLEPVNGHVGPPQVPATAKPLPPLPLDSGWVLEMLEMFRREREARRPEHEADWVPNHIVPWKGRNAAPPH
jgi:hypothetical protein